MSSVFHTKGVGYHETEIADDLYAFSIDPAARAGGVPAAPDQDQAALRPDVQEPDLHLLRRRHAGPAGAGHDREGLGAGAARPAGETGRQVRPRDRGCARHGSRRSGSCAHPKTFGDIARVGPIKRQADTIYEFITDPDLTSVCAVAWPEEMPVNETLDLRRNLQEELGLDLDRIFMNGLYPELFSDDEAATAARAPRGSDEAANGAGAWCCGRRSGPPCRSTAARPRSAAAAPAAGRVRGGRGRAAVPVSPAGRHGRCRRKLGGRDRGRGSEANVERRRPARGQADLHLRGLRRRRQDDHLGGDRDGHGGAGA